jgi:glutathione S-transferase
VITETLNRKLDTYEGILAKQDYLAGSSFSLVDIWAMPYMNLMISTTGDGDFILSRPHVKAWWERITEREAWKKLLTLE